MIVLKHERCFDPSEQKILKTVVSKRQVGRISALVLTHCEHLSKEAREKEIEQFKKESLS